MEKRPAGRGKWEGKGRGLFRESSLHKKKKNLAAPREGPALKEEEPNAENGNRNNQIRIVTGEVRGKYFHASFPHGPGKADHSGHCETKI